MLNIQKGIRNSKASIRVFIVSYAVPNIIQNTIYECNASEISYAFISKGLLLTLRILNLQLFHSDLVP